MKQGKVFGVLLILIGLLIILGNLDVIDIGFWQILGTYWPLLLIAAGFYNIITNPAGRIGGFIVLGIGVLFQLNNLDQLDIFENISIWPVILILIGVGLLFRGRDNAQALERNKINSISIFSGRNSRVISQDFMGGSSISIFGGSELDFRSAGTREKEIRFDAFVLFGGDDIYVPENWNVDISGLPIFGGWDDNTSKKDFDPEMPTLAIKCLILFGGIDVSN